MPYCVHSNHELTTSASPSWIMNGDVLGNQFLAQLTSIFLTTANILIFHDETIYLQYYLTGGQIVHRKGTKPGRFCILGLMYFVLNGFVRSFRSAKKSANSSTTSSAVEFRPFGTVGRVPHVESSNIPGIVISSKEAELPLGRRGGRHQQQC